MLGVCCCLLSLLSREFALAQLCLVHLQQSRMCLSGSLIVKPSNHVLKSCRPLAYVVSAVPLTVQQVELFCDGSRDKGLTQEKARPAGLQAHKARSCSRDECLAVALYQAATCTWDMDAEPKGFSKSIHSKTSSSRAFSSLSITSFVCKGGIGGTCVRNVSLLCWQL